MKQTFTLVAAIVLSFFSAKAQISQGFESTSSLSQLTNLCWQFSSGVVFNTGSRVNGTNSLEVYPITNGTVTSASTPYVSLSSGANISLNYQLSSKLANNANRSITVKLQAYNGTTTTLTTLSLDKGTATTTQVLSTASTTTGVFKIVVEVTGNNDGNTSVYLDDFSIAGAYNNSAPYNCNGTSNGPLPIYLKSFQSSVQGEQVQLQWQVAENETGNYFELEKSTDGRVFKTAAYVATTEKKGDEVYAYSENLAAATYYRLKIVNSNKSVSYSNVIFVKKQTAEGSALNLLQNPVKQNLQFSFSADRAGLADVVVYNVNGVKVYQTKLNVQKGVNNLSADLQNLTMKGTYLLEVRTAESRGVVKFLKD